MSDELQDEIEVINSIYGPSTLQPADSSSDSRTYILKLPRARVSPSHTDDSDATLTSLRILFPHAYPAEKPVVAGTHSAGRRGMGAQDLDLFAAALEVVYTPGEVCVFDAMEEYARAAEQHHQDADQDAEPAEHECQDSSTSNTARGVVVDIAEVAPQWTLSEVVVENKSTFVARVARITAPEQPARYLAHLLQTDRRARAATHNILAWRVRLPNPAGVRGEKGETGEKGGKVGGERTAQDYDDDGETAAGGRLLKLMQAMGVWDAMVVVTRWYGGVKLGPRRFAVINMVARDGFVRAGMVVDGKKR